MRIEMLLVPTAFAQHFYFCFYLMLCIDTAVNKFSFIAKAQTVFRQHGIERKTCKMKIVTTMFYFNEIQFSLIYFLCALVTQKNPLGCNLNPSPWYMLTIMYDNVEMKPESDTLSKLHLLWLLSKKLCNHYPDSQQSSF